MLHPGLEPVVADELMRDLGAEVKKTARGITVFRLNEITPDVVKLRTTEDVELKIGEITMVVPPADIHSFTAMVEGTVVITIVGAWDAA